MTAGAGRLVVDGMNVVGARPDGWWRDRDGAVRALVERLRLLAAAEGLDVCVVFDGRPVEGAASGGGVEVRYATRSGPDAADDDIVALVRGLDDPREVGVVTSDRGLRDRLADLPVDVTGAGALQARLDALRL